MGFLTVNGMLMTYDEYRKKTVCYNKLGIMQFVNLYNIHKDKQIAPENLHWGEEIEYHLYSFDYESKTVKLSCDAVAILSKYAMYTDE